MSVNSRMQRIAIGAVAAAALSVGLYLSLPYFLSEQRIRAEVTRSIQAATGITPRIDGEARLTLLPRPAIRLTDVQFDDGTKNGQNIGSLQASVQFVPLLFGEVKIAAITLEYPRLAVEFTADGKLVGRLPVAARMPAEDEDVPELRIINGSLLLRVQGNERVEIISGLQASLSWAGASLTATGTFSLRNQPANATLVIADTAALAKGQRSGLRLRLDSEPLRLSYEGGISYRDALQAEGSFSADSASLRRALAMFGVSAPSPQGFGHFSAKATVTLTPISLALANFSLELDGNRAAGALTLKRDSGERAILQGTLASESADLTRYQGIVSLLTPNGHDWNREPIEVSALRNLDLDLRFSFGKLVLGKVELTKVAAATALKDRQLTLSIGEAQFYGGTMRGSATLIATGEVPEVRVDANLVNFELERGLGGMTGFRRLEGVGSVSFAVSGHGRSVQEIMRALLGKLELSMKQGALNGINAELVLRRLERRPLSGTGDLRGGRTPFDRLAVNMQIEKGVAKLATFDIESQILKIKLSGDTLIARRELDLRGVATLNRPQQGNTPPVAFDLPFMIQGSWENPYLLPDPEALIRHSGAAAPLLDAVRGRAAREAMRDVIETVTGLRSIGELPVNPSALPPTFDPPPTVNMPVAAPAPTAPEQ
jgi:AsmA protein